MDFFELYMVRDINKIQVEFEMGGYASVWKGIIAPDRFEKWKIYDA